MNAEAGAGHLDRHEIIVVRRRHGHEDAHHGGVWKIAFADFMTAMMAFFLVMWLTNSSDMATKRQVAQYFNPIKLSDPTPALRGIEARNDGVAPEEQDKGNSEVQTRKDPHGKPLAGEQKGGEEQALFRDPYAVLAEIAAEGVNTKPEDQAGKPDGSGLPGLNGGDAYRDPFDPASWQLSPNTVAAKENVDAAPPAEFQTIVTPAASAAQTKADAAAAGVAAGDTRPVPAGASDARPDAEAATEAVPAPRPKPSDTVGGAKDDAPGATSAERKEAAALRSDIEEELAKSGEAVPANLRVSAGKGGVTISLTDDVTTGMFAIGSARPTPEIVKMMEKIAAVLAKRSGDVVIRGHTDSRPFNNAQYDNWRLSAARAQMAYYMLTRGGLEEKRVKSIEGLADRDPARPDDPEAAANRRIDILLREPSA